MENLYTQANLTGVDLTRYNAIQAEREHEKLSGKYRFIPTMRVVDVLGSVGWSPVQAAEIRCRNEDRKGFQKHLIRFRNDALTVSGRDQILPEIVLTNSHDGLASFQIMAGLFRLVCSNGLVIADSMFASHKIKHMGYTDQAVIEAVEAVSDTVPLIAGRVSDFQDIELTEDERGIYAMAALSAKYGEDDMKDRDFQIDRLLMPVRSADRASNLWATFNTVQEKLIKGGKFEKKATYPHIPTYKKTVKAKAVSSISENVRINRALWMLTEKMAELKGAAL